MTQANNDSHINLARETGTKFAKTAQPIITEDKPVLAPASEGRDQITIAHVGRAVNVSGENKK